MNIYSGFHSFFTWWWCIIPYLPSHARRPYCNSARLLTASELKKEAEKAAANSSMRWRRIALLKEMGIEFLTEVLLFSMFSSAINNPKCIKSIKNEIKFPWVPKTCLNRVKDSSSTKSNIMKRWIWGWNHGTALFIEAYIVYREGMEWWYDLHMNVFGSSNYSLVHHLKMMEWESRQYFMVPKMD